MRRLLFAFLVGCGTDEMKPSLEGPYSCGPNTCSTGQVCVTVESGSQCDVDPERGIGQYQVYSWTCVDLPAACDGIPSCDCVQSGKSCFGVSEDGREISTGCI